MLKELQTASIVVPSLWFLEVSNGLIMGERSHRLRRTETDEALTLIHRLTLHVDDRSSLSLVSDVLALARQYMLTTYDAAYLELALRLSLPLATLDRRLGTAAKKAGIRLYRAK